MDLKNMTATEALRAAKDASGLSVDELRKLTGISAHVLTQYFRTVDGYLPALDKIPALCRALGNIILIQWIEAQVARETPSVPPAQSRADVLTAVARAGSALGEVQGLLADTKAIHPGTARELRSALGDVITACRRAQEGLQPLAEQKDMRDMQPLMSLRHSEQRKPWWRRFHGK